MHRRISRFVAALALVLTSCAIEPSPPLPPHTFAFAVFGDGPYRAWEVGRFRHMIKDVNRTDLAWFLHVGDIFWYPCSNLNYERALEAMNAIQHPVVYTPGDNEWADCHDRLAGSHDPLERLAHLRKTFFANPGRSVGQHPMPLEPQSEDPAYAEFVENARWMHGGFVFATVHMVGAENATMPFEGRGAANDEEAARRIRAGIAWMESAFALADSMGLKGVVIAMHGSPGLHYHPRPRPGYVEFLERLEALTKAFGGPVLLIHGDGHQYQADHSLRDRATYEPLKNFTRLETYGSPDIGWVRVVVDTVSGEFTFEPRMMRRWWLW
ncbi:MAG TPA: hypothetical protein VEC56_02845 [Candidatus Krumholzibacteria bacterium]|nr:hypothetical protein [Candidatus Krumholzibacteria bacterium]